MKGLGKFLWCVLLAPTILLSVAEARSNVINGVTLERHSDRPGSDYRDFYTDNARECARQCGREDRCRAFAYQNEAGHCWLKDRVPRRNEYGPSVSGVKRDSGRDHNDPPAYPRDMDIEAHTDRQGGDFYHQRMSHAADCAQLCDRKRRCRAFSYNKDNQLCWLKDRVPRGHKHQPSVSGVKRRGNDRYDDRYDDY